MLAASHSAREKEREIYIYISVAKVYAEPPYAQLEHTYALRYIHSPSTHTNLINHVVIWIPTRKQYQHQTPTPAISMN